jgi:hypothetical protein
MADFVYGLAGLSDIVSPSSIPGGSGGSSFTPVRVVDIVLNGDHPRFVEVGEWNGIGTIFYNSVTDPTTQNNLQAIS